MYSLSMYSPRMDPMAAAVEAPRSPFNRLDDNHFGARFRPTSSASPPPPPHAPLAPTPSRTTTASATAASREDHSAIRREQQRRKLVGLHHAAFCTNIGNAPCPGHSHCLAHKRLFSHMIACREGGRCVIPGCSKGRLIWTHFSTCTKNIDCHICSVIPQEERNTVCGCCSPAIKAHLPKSPKSAMASSLSLSSSSYSSPVRTMGKKGRPPLSPKPRYHDLPPRSPPRSPARS